MSKVLFLVNHDVVIYNFRLEIVEELLKEGHEVAISSPYGERIDALVALGCSYYPIELSRHSVNPLGEAKLLLTYIRLIKEVEPDIVFTFTIKPNVYGGMACSMQGVPYVANITGLGTAVENGGLMQKFTLFLYRVGLRKAQKVFFQNEANQNFMLSHKAVRGAYDLLPGSGVNLKAHRYEIYPTCKENELMFLVIGRIMRDKGTDEILFAAEQIKREYPQTKFTMVGMFDGDYAGKITQAEEKGIIKYLGVQREVHEVIKDCHAVVHASYHEGMSNVLLEAAACGRPVIATDVPGCRETYDDGISGISCRARDGESLLHALRRFIELPFEKKREMGTAGRKKMEIEFDREIVIKKYMDELKNT